VSFRIINKDSTIEERIKKAINRVIYEKDLLNNKLEKLRDECKSLIVNEFLRSETFFALANGILKAEFGLSDEAVGQIPELLHEILTVEVSLVGSALKNGLVSITIDFVDNEGIDFSKHGVYYSNDYLIPWLLWLLVMEERDVVPNYKLYLKEGRGRSELAIMIKASGQSYSVEGYFAGRPGDNWITRTLRDSKSKITELIKGIMDKPL